MGTIAARVRVSRRALAVAAVVVLVVGGLAAWLNLELRSLGLQVPDAAVDSAVAQLKASTGAQRVDVVTATGWDDCAVVTLQSPDRDLTVSVAMVNETGKWRLARQTGWEVGFDTDDVLGSHESCLIIARSTGPLPPEEDEASAQPQSAGT